MNRRYVHKQRISIHDVRLGRVLMDHVEALKKKLCARSR